MRDELRQGLIAILGFAALAAIVTLRLALYDAWCEGRAAGLIAARLPCPCDLCTEGSP